MTKRTKNKTKKPQNQASIDSKIAAAVKRSLNLRSVAPRPQRPKPPKNTFLGDLGALAGNGISKIFGLGAYSLNQNSLYSTQGQVPFMHSSDESIVFRHREFITDVSSTTAFTAKVYNVNPGLGTTFPYLSAIAGNFQQYKMQGLIFEYKTTSATALVNGTNTAMGSVMLAAQYASDDAAFNTKQEMLNEMWSVDGRPSENLILPIECAPSQTASNLLYVRNGGIPSGSDIKNFDLCKLSFATAGFPAANVIGELWVSYEVHLMKPSLSDGGALVAMDHSSYTSVLGTNFIGEVFVSTYMNQIGTTASGVIGGASTITFPTYAVGNYMILVQFVGTNAVQTYGTVSYTNCAALPFDLLGVSPYAPQSGVTTGRTNQTVVLNIPDNGVSAVVSVATGQYPSNCTCNYWVMQLPDHYA